MSYKVLFGYRIFSKKFIDISKTFFSIEIKIKLKSTLYFDFCFVSKLVDLELARNKPSTQMSHKITYNTIILAKHDIKFLDLNFLCILKALALLDCILSLSNGQNFCPKTL